MNAAADLNEPTRADSISPTSEAVGGRCQKILCEWHPTQGQEPWQNRCAMVDDAVTAPALLLPLTRTSMRPGEGNRTLVLSLGKIGRADLTNDDELERQLKDSANEDERPRTHPDLP
jgi:hypothetical protein